MSQSFPAPPGKIIGRDAYVQRFLARLEHFAMFAFEGLPGIGKTALTLHLAKLTTKIGAKQAIFLHLSPGETIGSLLGRSEARLKARVASSEQKGDPFAQLLGLLDNRRTTLVLDEMHNLRREDLGGLVRATRGRLGNYRILGSSRSEPEVSAMDRALLVLERVGGLTVDEVKKLAHPFKVPAPTLERLLADAARGGSVCQPFTLHALLELRRGDFPDDAALQTVSARSVNAFRALVGPAIEKLPEAERDALLGLSRVGLPVSLAVAKSAFGAAVGTLVKRRLLDVIDGDVYLHLLVAQLFASPEKLDTASAKAIAKHLEQRGVQRREPVCIIRAGELLAHAGIIHSAVDTLASGWEDVRDLGFFEAYLKTLSTIPAEGELAPRLKLLAARARIRRDMPLRSIEELEQLIEERDGWTRQRAWASLVTVYSYASQHADVVKAYEALDRLTSDVEVIGPAGALAAEALVKLGRVADAEKLSTKLLKLLRGKEQLDRQGELHRLLARIYSQAGRLAEAVEHGREAAKFFEESGDLYHAGGAQGFIGDLYRETGDFELARTAYARFRVLAQTWGDRNLIQIAELAEAWVALDVGDMPTATKLIDKVEKELSAAASRRLRRYLATARALLAAGRGQHAEASSSLPRVIEAWEQAGQQATADILRAQLVRSLIAGGQLDQADAIVRETLKRLDSKTAAPRLASFLRESALLRLRRKDVKHAMAELAEARQLFAQGGNRREEALTLHRIAHAALDEGDTELAERSAKEAHQLATKIRHARAAALAREVEGRVALRRNQPQAAVKAIKEASSALRRLGDDLGTLHVSESLLRAYLVAGDLNAAIRLSPRVRDHADRLQIRDLRNRAIVLGGVALIRRGRLDAAAKCFREIPEQALPAETEALMWRLGEALAAVAGEKQAMLERRANWVRAIRRLPEVRHPAAVQAIRQLGLQPRERGELRTKAGAREVDTEDIAWIDHSAFDVFVDLVNDVIIDHGQTLAITAKEQRRLFRRLLLESPKVVEWGTLCEAVYGESDPKPEKRLKTVLREINKVFKNAQGIKLIPAASGLKLALGGRAAALIPIALTAKLIPRQMRLLRLLSRQGSAGLPKVQEVLGLNRAAARRELGELVKLSLVEAIRDGRGQAFRLR